MSAVDIIARVEACGARLWIASDGKLHVSGRSRIPDELVDVATRRAEDVKAYMREHAEVISTADAVLAAITFVRGHAER